MITHRALLALCLGLPICAQDPVRSPLPEDRARGATAIADADLRGWLEVLASPECAGRATGTDGYLVAASLVRDHFRELGLEPAGDDGSYWQQVPWTQRRADPERTHLELRNGDVVLCKLTPLRGLHGRATVDSSASGAVVLLTAPGVDAPLPDADVEDKIAVVWAPDAGDPRKLARRVRAMRPAAWIVVHDEAFANAMGLVGASQPGAATANRAIRGRGLTPTELFTTRDAVAGLWQVAGLSPAEQGLEARVFELADVQAELQIRIHTTEAPAANVVGILRGADPDLREEYVMVASHLDHLGNANGKLHPGADDDGSGSVGVMALARAFVENPVQPRRSMVFATFCGEERGLLGSDYFVRNPPFPLSSLVAELQMDMIGRSEENRDESAADNLNCLHLIGTKQLSYDLHELCVARNDQSAGFDLEYDEEDVFYRSDHFNFARRGVPIAFFFTGFHRDYHKPGDTVDKIDFDKLRRVSTYVYDIAFELARTDHRPLIDANRWTRLRRELKGRASREPAAPLKQ